MSANEPLMKPRQVAEFLSISEATLRAWRSYRRVDGSYGPRYLHLGGSIIRYQQSDLDRWLFHVAIGEY